MATYNNQTDIPKFTDRSANYRGQPYFTYKGQKYSPASVQATFPQQYADWSKASGQNPAIAAGSAGSPYPKALPANSFEELIGQARKQMDESRAANEKRYGQALSNTSNQGKLVDSSFDALKSQIDADNAAYDTEAAGIQSNFNQGYDKAEQALTGYGDYSISEFKREGKSREAQATQNAVGRGLYNSTVLDAMQRREREATDRNVAGVQESVAGMRTGLLERRAGAGTDLLSMIAQNRQQGRLRAADVTQKRFGAKYQQLQDRRQVITDRIDEGPDEVTLANLILQNQQALAAEKAAKKKNSSSNILGGLAGSLLGSVGGGLGSGIGGALGGLFSKDK